MLYINGLQIEALLSIVEKLAVLAHASCWLLAIAELLSLYWQFDIDVMAFYIVNVRDNSYAAGLLYSTL